MNTIRNTAAIAVLSLVTMSGVQAASTPAAAPKAATAPLAAKYNLLHAEGKLSSISTTGNSITLTEKNKTVSYTFDKTTRWTENGKAIAPESIMPGRSVKLVCEEEGNKLMVRDVLVLGASNMPKPMAMPAKAAAEKSVKK